MIACGDGLYSWVLVVRAQGFVISVMQTSIAAGSLQYIHHYFGRGESMLWVRTLRTKSIALVHGSIPLISFVASGTSGQACPHWRRRVFRL
jgi:hypothetical protein